MASPSGASRSYWRGQAPAAEDGWEGAHDWLLQLLSDALGLDAGRSGVPP